MAGLQAVPVLGEAADAAFLAMAYAYAGWDGLRAVVHLVEAVHTAVEARSEAEIAAAAPGAAEALVTLGGAFLDAVALRMAKRNTSGGGKAAGGGEEAAQTINTQRGQGVGGKTAGSRSSTIAENARKGAVFEQEGIAYLETTQTDVAEQVSVRPYDHSGQPTDYRVRLDAMGRDDTGALRLTDFKSSETAGLNQNQQAGYPLLKDNGGQVVGNNGGAAYPAGFPIPPTPVDIVKPRDF